jgi:hypothetical protein
VKAGVSEFCVDFAISFLFEEFADFIEICVGSLCNLVILWFFWLVLEARTVLLKKIDVDFGCVSTVSADARKGFF